MQSHGYMAESLCLSLSSHFTALCEAGAHLAGPHQPGKAVVLDQRARACQLHPRVVQLQAAPRLPLALASYQQFYAILDLIESDNEQDEYGQAKSA